MDDERDELGVPNRLRRALAEAGLGLEFAQLPLDERRRLGDQAAQDGDLEAVLAEVRRHRLPPAGEHRPAKPGS